MSTRKSTNKSQVESPTSDASSTASSTRLATARASASAQQQQAAGNSDADLSSCDLPDVKRRRRTGPTPTTPTITSLKKSDENDDTMSSIDDADDDRSVKSLIEDMKTEEVRPSSRTSSRLSQSPTKKPTIFDKSRIVTRKVALDFVKNNTRALRGGKRNSKETIKGTAKDDPAKKRIVKKVQVSPSVKRKRDSKCEDKDLEEKGGKLLKLIKQEIDDTKNDDEDGNLQDDVLLEEENFKLFVDEVDSKDDELVEVVQIKSELDEETEDTLLGDECTKSSDLIEVQKESESQEKEADTVMSDEILDEKPDVVEKVEIKKEPEDVKFAAYERPRRGRPKKVDIDTPTTSSKRAAVRKNDKQNTPDTGSETKTKAAKAQSRASSAGGKKKTVEKPKDDSIKTEDGLRTDINDVQEPLTVDTSNLIAPDKDSPSTSSGQESEKAASLSPELISEGINVISVKQFYKKPEFLENNLGIENDPNLGEIVQKVEKVDEEPSMPIKTEAGTPVPALNPEETDLEANKSGDSIKEGELLVLEDSTDDSNRLNDPEIDDQINAPILSPQSDKTSINVNLENIEPPKLKIEADTTLSSPRSEPNNITDIIKIICDNKPLKTSNIKAVDINKRNSVNESDSNKNVKDKTDNNVDVVVANVFNKCEKKINKILPKDLALALIEAVKGDVISNDTRIQKTEQQSQMDADSGVSDVAENIEDIDDSKKIDINENDKVADLEDGSNPDCNDDEIDDSKMNEDSADSLKDINEKMTIKSENPKSSDKKLLETPETLKQKENHFKSLGLLTHKAAVEAKIEKQRRRKLYQTNIPSGKKNGNGNTNNGNNGSNNNNNNNNDGPDENGKQNGTTATAAGGTGICNKTQQEYTGTLKTVIKLNRQPGTTNNNTDNKRKSATSSNGNGNGRQSLKMTFQKGRGRGIYNNNEKDANQSTNSSDDTYYTIQNETENVQPQEALSHGRKLHNRSHTSEVPPPAETPEVTDKKEEKEIILIPEKASSFSIHPGRLCQDQCFYCGGRFGLYDTPCHVAQLKSVERQQKILENEEKLTVDNCLCDACFRHVDRRANVPSYKKRLSAPATLSSAPAGSEATTSTASTAEDISEQSEKGEQKESAPSSTSPPTTSSTASKAVCFVPDCNNPASHSLRRKFFRKTIRKILPHFALSSIGSTAPICSKHYESVLQFLGCSLCKRRLGKNHAHHIYQDSDKLEKLLGDQGIPVKLGVNPAVCKLCKYFTNLLLKPPDGAKIQKKQFVKNYRRRLLHFHNIKSEETPSDTEEQGDDKSEDESKDEEEEPVKPKEIQNTSTSAPSKRGRKKKAPAIETIELEKDSPTRSNSPQSSDDYSVSITGTRSGQMVLDNDVMVDYDVPVMHDSPSPPPAVQMPSKLQTILQGGRPKPKNDISSVLRANPNISMRELFPGEEEMGLQVKVPFGSSSSQRTPEGWTRVQTFLQYDDPTKRLWEELQKPYGNQSSFLRHLILLEKYFRNGDLVLSPNANSNATVYSNTVQNRLKSYDNNQDINARTIGKSKPNPTNHQRHMEKVPRLMNNLPVTITAKPKLQNSTNKGNSNASSNSSSRGNTPNTTEANIESSILKTNLLNNKNIEILPINSSNDSSKNTPSTSGLTIQQKLLAAANKLITNNDNTGTSNQSAKKLSSANNPGIPPQLICINRNQNNTSTAMSKNRPYSNPRPGTSKSIPPNVIVLPDTLSPIERMQSKNWRPTLIPVSSGAHSNQMGPLYQTAEGRRLPGLVQVQSGGRPFLISIHDYNRMCIMRREKLLRDQMLKTNKNNISMQGGGKTSNNLSQNKLQIPNKVLEQNSVIPVGSQSNRSQLQKVQNDQKYQLPQPMLVKTSNNLIPIAPKPPQPQLHMVPQSIASAQHTIVLGTSTQQQNPAISIIPSLSGVLTLGPPTTASSSTSYLWTSTEQTPRTSIHQINKTTQPIASTSTAALSSSSSSSSSSSNSSSPSVLKQHLAQHPQQGNSSGVVLDNTLLSKIPKSLTVIPQQKSHRRSRGNSAEDLNSA